MYDAIVPGAAERIIAMAEQQAAHRQHLEKAVIEGNIRGTSQARVVAAIVSLAFIGASIYLAHLGYPAMAISGIGATLATLAGVNVYGTASARKEREKKNAELKGGDPPK